MIIIKHTVEIESSPERIFDFLVNLRENYPTWHPDHVEWRPITDGPLREGSTVYIVENSQGKLYKHKTRITKFETNSRIENRIVSGVKEVFFIEPQGANSLFTVAMHVGTRIPLLGTLLDWFMRRFRSNQLEFMEQHMVEEGQNLKRILEEGSQSSS